MKMDKLFTIAEKKRTPFYLYDLAIVQQKIDAIKTSLPSFNLLFSVKANPNKEIICFLLSKGVGFDVASVNELLLVSSLGAKPSNIYYSAPGKTESDISGSFGKCHIIADSINELFRINNIAKSHSFHLTIGIRLNIENQVIMQSNHEIMSGISTKFGISIEELCSIDFSSLSNISIDGIHIYFGSQILDESIIANNFHIISYTAFLLMAHYDLKYINYGGGFGVPYLKEEKPLDLKLLSDSLQQDDSFLEIKKAGVRLNIELGRFLVADSGLFFTRVVDIKTSFGKKYAILDAGMNSFFRPIMTGEFHEVLQHRVEPGFENITLVGHLCTPIDTYYDNLRIHPLKIEDIIAFKNAGAYGYSMSLLNFISYDPPDEYVVNAQQTDSYSIQ